MQNSYIENLVGNGKVSVKSTIPYSETHCPIESS